MERQKILDALSVLPEAEFAHVCEVLADVVRRLPDRDYSTLRSGLGLPEPELLKESVPAEAGPNDVTVAVTGVSASGEAGGLA